jgi:hypothetical protein
MRMPALWLHGHGLATLDAIVDWAERLPHTSFTKIVKGDAAAMALSRKKRYDGADATAC